MAFQVQTAGIDIHQYLTWLSVVKVKYSRYVIKPLLRVEKERRLALMQVLKFGQQIAATWDEGAERLHHQAML